MNKNEAKVLHAIFENALACSGGDFGFTDEMIETGVEGLTTNQIKCYVSALQSKSLIYVDSDYQVDYNKESLQTLIGHGLIDETYAKQFEVWYY